jgi:hypothetical protein
VGDLKIRAAKDAECMNKLDCMRRSTHDQWNLRKYSHEQPDQTLLVVISQPVGNVTGLSRKSTDPIEEKASEVVVPLTQKSHEHDEEQERFRGECRHNGMSGRVATKGNTCTNVILLVCGLSRLRGGKMEDRSNSCVL